MKINIIALIYYNENKLLTQQLIRESSFITEYLVRELQIYNFFDCTRINFICREEEVRTDIRFYGGILELDAPFERKYFDMNRQEKQNYLYKLLFDSFKILYEKKQWQFDGINKIFDEFMNNNCASLFYTRLQCKKDKKIVRLLGEQTIEQVKFYLEIQDKYGFYVKHFWFSTNPNVFDYDRFLGYLEWTENEEIFLFGKDKNSIYKFNIANIKND